MIHSPDSLRQAAILISSLDAALAKQLLNRLEPEEAAKIRQAATMLGRVSPTERQTVFQAFTNACPAPHALHTKDPGVEVEDSLAALFADSANKDDPSTNCPFDFLKEADTDTLVHMLQKEHPQTIAVVLSYLPAECAADLLVRLPIPLQVGILRRLSDLEPGDPESVQAVAIELRTWVHAQEDQKRQRERGLAAVQGILSAVDRKKQATLVDQIQLHDIPLATRLGLKTHGSSAMSKNSSLKTTPSHSNRPPLEPNPDVPASISNRPRQEAIFSECPTQNSYHFHSDAPSRRMPLTQFENLIDLDEWTWSTLLRSIEPELTILALTGADEALIDRMASHLTPTEATRLRRLLASPGPTRLSDVENARRELIQVANQIVHSPRHMQSTTPSPT
ncbi:MAG: hypothetical protein JW829_12625 [Pirellulales bacterium]|nr:hypothetical protein [Pirellulales bacterium]